MTNLRQILFMVYLVPLSSVLSLEAANLNTQQYFIPQYYKPQQQQFKPFQQQQQQEKIKETTPFGQILGNTIVNSNTISNSERQSTYSKPPIRHPQLQPSPVAENTVLDRYNIRYPDGSYEFRYELTDGTARYERGYFLRYDKLKTLVVVGYYSYRMPDGRYITVFYNADQNGYRQNQSITPQTYPNLPRSIEVPQFKDDDIPLNQRDETFY